MCPNYEYQLAGMSLSVTMFPNVQSLCKSRILPYQPDIHCPDDPDVMFVFAHNYHLVSCV